MITLAKSDVASLLNMTVAIDLVEKAMISTVNGAAVLPLRHAMDVGAPNLLGVMSGALSQPPCYGTKLISLFPDNPAKGFSSHLGLMVLFERENGTPTALMDAGILTAIRTAAASAVATRALARKDATTLTIIGTGEQAWHHIESMLAVRDITDLRIVSRTPQSAQKFAQKAGAAYPGLSITCPSNVKEAVRGADIICTVTSAKDTVLQGAWVEKGCHVNAVGASIPTLREIDQDMITRARLFVDYRPSALSQAGDIIASIKAGVIDETHILGEIGEVLEGAIKGRDSQNEITLYRSMGIAAQDLICAHYVMEQSKLRGLGTQISIF